MTSLKYQNPLKQPKIMQYSEKPSKKLLLLVVELKELPPPISDWDYLVCGNRKQAHSAKSSLPRGTQGGHKTRWEMKQESI